MVGVPDGPGTGQYIRQVIESGRADIEEVEKGAHELAELAARKERRSRLLNVWTAVGALVVAFVAVVIAVSSSTTRSTDVVERLAPEVARQVVADARAQRVENARRVLQAANEELVRRRLPMIADPGPTANAEQITTAAVTAQVLSLLPEGVAEQLRQESDGDVLVTPTAAGTLIRPPGDVLDGLPTTVPPNRSPGITTAPRTRSPSTGVVPAPAPAPRPSAPPTERRLIPPLIPLPLPLIGT